MPTAEENAAINAGIAADPDSYEMSPTEFKQLRPMRGRPVGGGTKVQMTVRFDADVIQAFKQGGDGWQTKMNDALRDWLTTHRVV
ncbi:BrnA antitoxin family protein [Glaciimonas immobilis]|nr:BrnA antitoxin family protein [Glaciimonas immobilis]